jgi:hypothetical protein
MKIRANIFVHPTNGSAASKIVLSVITFLQLFIPKTLAKRIISIVLVAAGAQNERITELTGLCSRSVRELRKNLKNLEVYEVQTTVTVLQQFGIFQETIDLIINSTHTFYKEAVNQLFDDLIAVTENSFRRNPHVQNIREAA